MQTPTSFAHPSRPAARRISSFKVITICEDLETARVAWRALDLLKGELGEDTEFHHGMWLIDIFQRQTLIEAALRDAGDLDFILLSFHNGRPFPRPALAFIREWLHHDPHHGALGVVACGRSSEVQSCRACLHRAAGQSGVQWLEQTVENEEPSPALRLFWLLGDRKLSARNPSPRIPAAIRNRRHSLKAGVLVES
jgi:hypothetical protein